MREKSRTRNQYLFAIDVQRIIQVILILVVCGLFDTFSMTGGWKYVHLEIEFILKRVCENVPARARN